MDVIQLDHYNIRVPMEWLDRLSRFYVDVLGLVIGYRPPFSSQGYWLYGSGRPLLHITGFAAAGLATPADTGWFNHIALKCSDFEIAVARLVANGIAYAVEEIPQLQQRQIFFTDPVGVGIEINFDTPVLSLRQE